MHNADTIATPVEPRRRGVDGGAVLRATVVASLTSLLLYLFVVPMLVGAGNAAIILRYMASVVLGPAVLPPPADLPAIVAATGLAVHFGLSTVMTAIIAFVLHRWGLLTGILGGAAFGAVFFVIIHYTLTALQPHFYAMNHWSVLLVHVLFGALAGGFYELYECEPGEWRGGGGQ